MFSVYEHENRDIFSGTKNYFAVVQSFFKKSYQRNSAIQAHEEYCNATHPKRHIVKF